MSKSPYFPMYSSDFIAGVAALTAEQRGIYITILCLIYEANGPIKYDLEELSDECRAEPSTLEKTLERLVKKGKLTLEDGYLMNGRAAEEIIKRTEKAAKATAAAEKRWRKKYADASNNDANAMQTQCEKDANAMRTQCEKDANAMRTQCEKDANAMRTHPKNMQTQCERIEKTCERNANQNQNQNQNQNNIIISNARERENAPPEKTPTGESDEPTDPFEIGDRLTRDCQQFAEQQASRPGMAHIPMGAQWLADGVSYQLDILPTVSGWLADGYGVGDWVKLSQKIYASHRARKEAIDHGNKNFFSRAGGALRSPGWHQSHLGQGTSIVEIATRRERRAQGYD